MINDTLQNELSEQDTAATLRRIVAAVERNERHGWLEFASAVVLSLATVTSAWCAYQASCWGGVETFRLAAATKAGREASSNNLVALQARTIDGSMLISYLEAQSRGDKQIENLLYQRFRPETKKAIEAWLKTDPLHNPDAPLSPFKMAEYVQPEMQEAERQNELFDQEHAAAHEASKTGDRYVLLTVLFASVLFFGGIGGTFDSRQLRISALAIALVLFGITFIGMVTMPICKG
jgi:hypothetical protein